MPKTKDKKNQKTYPKRTHKQLSKDENEEVSELGKKKLTSQVIKI